MKTIQNTKVVDDNGTVIAGSDDSYWIEVHPSDADAVAQASVAEVVVTEGRKRIAYDKGANLARDDGNGDAALHAAMVEDASRGLRSVFFYWDEENGTWWRVGLADL